MSSILSHNVSLIVAVAFLVPGIFMAFVPMLPALSYMFVIALLFGFYDRFVTLSGWNLGILLCITLVSIFIDHAAGVLGAKYTGAHTKSLIWGIFGGFVGLFIFPALGSFIGLFLAVFISEMYYKRHHIKAFRSAGGALLGSIAGVIANGFLAVIFLVTFIFLALK